MHPTNKEQELINVVEDFNSKWRHKIDEINLIPATFPKDNCQIECIYWADESVKQKWKLHRETWMNHKNEEITYYTYGVYWLYGKGYCRKGDIIKHAEIEIYNAQHYLQFVRIPLCRMPNGARYGQPFTRDRPYIYKDDTIYKLISCSKANKPSPTVVIS